MHVFIITFFFPFKHVTLWNASNEETSRLFSNIMQVLPNQGKFYCWCLLLFVKRVFPFFFLLLLLSSLLYFLVLFSPTYSFGFSSFLISLYGVVLSFAQRHLSTLFTTFSPFRLRVNPSLLFPSLMTIISFSNLFQEPARMFG